MLKLEYKTLRNGNFLPLFTSGQQSVDLTKSEQKRVNLVKDVLSTLKLNPAHLYNVLFNNPSKAAPYHNTQHLLTVAIYSYKGGLHYRLPQQDLRVIFLAALYHDWDHTASDADDSINIQRALIGTADIFRFESSLNEEDIETIHSLIQASLYPHVNPVTILEEILQDADLLQYCEEDSIVFIEGIGKELNMVSTLDTTKAFLKGNKFNTEWALALLTKASLI